MKYRIVKENGWYYPESSYLGIIWSRWIEHALYCCDREVKYRTLEDATQFITDYKANKKKEKEKNKREVFYID